MSGARPRVIVLDDDPLLRRALDRIAHYSDVDLETVGDIESLRRRVEDPGVHFDLVVCDYRLKIDGKHLTSAALVRELVERGLRVVLMTGLAETVQEDVAGVPVLEKPLRLEDIVAYVR